MIDGRAGDDDVSCPLVRYSAVMSLFVQPRPVKTVAAAVAERASLQNYFAQPGVLVSRPAPGGRLAVSIKAGGNGGHITDVAIRITSPVCSDRPPDVRRSNTAATPSGSLARSRRRHSLPVPSVLR